MDMNSIKDNIKLAVDCGSENCFVPINDLRKLIHLASQDNEYRKTIDRIISMLEVDHVLGMDTKCHAGIGRVINLLRECKERGSVFITSEQKVVEDNELKQYEEDKLTYGNTSPQADAIYFGKELMKDVSKKETTDTSVGCPQCFSQDPNPTCPICDGKGRYVEVSSVDSLVEKIEKITSYTLKDAFVGGVTYYKREDLLAILKEYSTAPVSRESVLDEAIEAIKKYDAIGTPTRAAKAIIEVIEQLKTPQVDK